MRRCENRSSAFIPVPFQQLNRFIQRFGAVIRAKGYVPTEVKTEWLYFDLVPGETEIRKGLPEYTGKVCVIGADLKEEDLEKEFRS